MIYNIIGIIIAILCIDFIVFGVLYSIVLWVKEEIEKWKGIE